MKKIFAVLIVASLGVGVNANAFFFFFTIPRSVTSAMADVLTGSEGENCVGTNVNVGSTIRLSGGNSMTVKSLSGISERCTQPEFPIRAMLSPSNIAASVPSAFTAAPLTAGNSAPTPPSQPQTAFTSSAGIDLPVGWSSSELTADLKSKGFFFSATNRTIDAGLLLNSTRRAGITSLMELSKSRRVAQLANLKDARASDIEELQINGFPAWRFEVTGTGTKGRDFSYLVTLIDTGVEIVDIHAFMLSASYGEHREELRSLASNIKGFSLPVALIEQSSGPTKVFVSPSLSPGLSAASRLTTLRKLLEDGLISNKDFDIKKEEILKSI